jgi:hypothetical protein
MTMDALTLFDQLTDREVEKLLLCATHGPLARGSNQYCARLRIPGEAPYVIQISRETLISLADERMPPACNWLLGPGERLAKPSRAAARRDRQRARAHPAG